MRILVTIPHFHRATDLGYYGSLGADHRPRLHGLTECLTSLHQTFGPAQGLLYGPERCTRPTNEATAATLDIVVCTSGDEHLVDQLPAGLCRRHATDAYPPLLGYECHTVLRDGIGRYDWYVYLEDDLCITDVSFFHKLAWFQELAGDDRCVLQPNRFEVTGMRPIHRLYIDGHPASDEGVPQRVVEEAPRRITAPFLSSTVAFQRVSNPHSGGFFLNDAQMRRWASAADFLDRATTYIGPLESAATLGLIRHFVVYKPARENAGFLELRHGDPRYLHRRLAFSDTPPYRYHVVSNKS